MVTRKVRTGKPGESVSIETVCGWILNGPLANKSFDSSANNISESHVLILHQCHITLTIKLSNFGDLETLGISPDKNGIFEMKSSKLSSYIKIYEIPAKHVILIWSKK